MTRSLLLALPLLAACPRGQSLPEPLVEAAPQGPPMPEDLDLGAELGTDDPLAIQAVDPAGRWVVACQARVDTDGDGVVRVGAGYHGDLYGDELLPWLMEGEGPGEALEDWIGSSPSGDHLLFLREGGLVLRQVDTGQEWPLDADTRVDPSPLGPHRVASFDEAGERLVYFHADQRTARLRHLSSGEEVVLDPGEGLPYRAWFDGDWIVVEIVTEDTDEDGTLSWPVLRTSLSDRRGHILSYSTGGWAGDQPRRRLFAADGSPVLSEHERLFGLGEGLVYLDDTSGSPELVVLRGQQEVLRVAAEFGPELLGDAEGGLYVACTAEAKAAPMFLLTVDGLEGLHLCWTPTYDPVWEEGFLRLDERRWWSPDLDLTVELEEGAWIRARAGHHLLVTRDDRASIVDVRSGRSTTLDVQVDAYDLQGAGEWFLVRDAARRTLLVHAPEARVLGQVAGKSYGLTESGWVLAGPESGDIVDEGPLWWVGPERGLAPVD